MPQHADELSLLQAQMIYKKRLEAVMTELRSQEEALAEKTRELEEHMILEQKDVERLEGNSLAVFFYNVIGKKDALLDKERREAYAARIKYDASCRELDAVREDIRETEEDLQDLQDCEARYAQLLEEERKELESMGTPDGRALLEKDRLHQYLENQERELEEAIIAGTSALRTLSQVLSDLHGAKDWRSIDIIGSAFLLDMAQHEKLDEAQENIETLQVQLQRFNKELSDVSIRGSLQASIRQMLKFADSIFDTLAEDLTLKDSIKQVYAHLDMTREQILGVLRQLQNTLEEVRHKLIRIREEMNEIVLSAEN